MRTVDVVIAGAGADAIEAAADAVRAGRSVLVVLRSRGTRVVQQLRVSLRAAGDATNVIVLTGAEVACADGVGGVEAVLVRNLRTGRLSAFNARAVVHCGAETMRPSNR